MIDEELKLELERIIEDFRRERERAIEEQTRFELMLEGKHPYRCHKGQGAAWNFTIGPAFLWPGPQAIPTINAATEPVVLFADYIEQDLLRKIDATRVRGYVFAKGSIIDPSYWWLVEENRASVTCCPSALADVRQGELVIIDGVRGLVYLDPDPQTRANYERLRQLGAPRRDHLYWDALKKICGAILANHQLRKQTPPFEFEEQERLIDLARRARNGEPLSREDDAWMQGLLMQGMPSVEEIQMRALGKTFDMDGKAKTPPSGRGRTGREHKRDAAKGERRAGGKGPASEPPTATESENERSARKSASERRAERERAIEEARRQKRAKKDKGDADKPPERDETASGGGGDDDTEPFDPLGDMMATP